MPGYVKKILQCSQHAAPSQQQDSPYRAPTLKYSAAAQYPLPEDTSDKTNEKSVNIIRQVIGGLLYYARAVGIGGGVGTAGSSQYTAQMRHVDVICFL